MSRLEIIIRKIDEENNNCEEKVLSTHRFEMLELENISREEVIDRLEKDTLKKGREIMRNLFIKQLELKDIELSSRRTHKNKNCQVRYEGYDDIKIISRLGIIEVPRQTCSCCECEEHFMPLNEILPTHKGIIVTRGFVEWGCLLSQDLPFETVSRLIGWMSDEEKLLSKNTIREIVKSEGKLIREAEKKKWNK